MFCKNCGKEIKGSEKFCPYCGQTVEKKVSEAENGKTSSAIRTETKSEERNLSSKQEKAKSKKWVFIIPLLIIVIAVIAFCVLNNASDNEEENPTEKADANTELIDIEELIGISVTEAEKYGFSSVEDYEEMMTNEDMSLMLICQDNKVIGVNVEDTCSYPFHGIYIGDTIEEAKNKLEDEFQVAGEGYSYLLAVSEEKEMSVWLGNSSAEESNVIDSIEIQTEVDVDSIIAENASIDDEDTDVSSGEGTETYDIPEEETGDYDSSEAGSDSFIGISGVYVCTNSDLDATGRISIYQTGNGCDFSLDTLELGYVLLSGSGKMISNNTMQIDAYGITITCTWSDSEHMYVTCSAINQGMDAATLDDTINGRNYVYATEFN